jgi:hypothetical protein
MNKKKIIIGLIVAGAVIGGMYLYNKNKKAKESSKESEKATAETNEEASSSFVQIGTQSCASHNNSVCTQACSNLGGTFNTGDRNCYKNGIAISGGLFGGGAKTVVSR